MSVSPKQSVVKVPPHLKATDDSRYPSKTRAAREVKKGAILRITKALSISKCHIDLNGVRNTTGTDLRARNLRILDE